MGSHNVYWSPEADEAWKHKKAENAKFEERAKDKCGVHRCHVSTPCSCRDWAKERYNATSR